MFFFKDPAPRECPASTLEADNDDYWDLERDRALHVPALSTPSLWTSPNSGRSTMVTSAIPTLSCRAIPTAKTATSGGVCGSGGGPALRGNRSVP